jgi:hypothetical protein
MNLTQLVTRLKAPHEVGGVKPQWKCTLKEQVGRTDALCSRPCIEWAPLPQTLAQVVIAATPVDHLDPAPQQGLAHRSFRKNPPERRSTHTPSVPN